MYKKIVGQIFSMLILYDRQFHLVVIMHTLLKKLQHFGHYIYYVADSHRINMAKYGHNACLGKCLWHLSNEFVINSLHAATAMLFLQDVLCS